MSCWFAVDATQVVCMLREMSPPPFIEPSPPRPVILLLCGWEQHGKTTAAKWLYDHHGFRRTSFADPIRAALVSTGVPAGMFEAAKERPCQELAGRTPREAMRSLGRWGRDIALDYWIRAWDRSIGDIGVDPLIVVDDARFDLEVEYALGVARRRGAELAVVRVDRPGWTRGSDDESNRIPDVPVGVPFARVTNFGTADDLGRSVESLLRGWRLL